MDISSSSNATSARQVTASSNSKRDRAAENQQQLVVQEKKAQEQAQQKRLAEERLQQRRNEERSLEGRLVSYGQKNGESAADYKQIAYNRSRVDDAYSSVKSEGAQSHHQQRHHTNDAIDIVV